MTGSLVLVTSSFPIRGDGSEAAGSFVADLVEELAREVAVRVVAPGIMTRRERWADNVEIHRYAAPARPLSTLKAWSPRDMQWIARIWRGGLDATRSAAKGANQILALWGLPCGEWARRTARELDLPYAVWMLGSDVWSLGRVPILRGMLARVMRGAARAYADGLQLSQDAQRIGGIPVTFLPSTRGMGSTIPPPPRARPPYRLLYLGRWHRNKGIDLLLDALALLADADWRKIERVEIQGGGPLDSLVRQRTAALRAAGRPVVAGHFLVKSDAEAAIARADWVLIPSRIESIPVVFSDAMKLGRPVIATPVGDLPALVKQGCGVLSRDVDAESLAAALAEFHQDSRYDPEAVKRCANSFSLPSIAARILSELPKHAGPG